MIDFSYLAALLASPWTWVWILVGLCLGSFANVCIYRIPEKTFWTSSRSRCRSCGALIAAWDNIPVISWLVLRGKSRCCGNPISPQYPLVELFFGVFLVALYWRFPFIEGPGKLHHLDQLRFIHALIFCFVLWVSSVIDLRLMIIPDVLSIGLIVTTPLAVWLSPELDWQSALYGVFLGGGLLYAVTQIYWLVRKQVGMGFGDVKLLAGMGGWLGWQSVFPTLLYASLSGSVIGLVWIVLKRQKTLQLEIPFGPFLALGGVIHLFFGPSLWHWLMGG